MSDAREADTLPPDSFREPPEAAKTDPPISPAMADAIRAACADAVAPLSEHWGNLYVAEQERIDRAHEKADNALKLIAEQGRIQAQRYLELHALLRKVAAHVGLPEELPIAELAARGGQ